MTPDRDKLRALARLGPQGPWRLEWVASYDDEESAWITDGKGGVYLDVSDLDADFARYIAAVSPDVVLALLDEMDRLDAALEKIAKHEGWDIDYPEAADFYQVRDIARAALAVKNEER